MRMSFSVALLAPMISSRFVFQVHLAFVFLMHQDSHQDSTRLIPRLSETMLAFGVFRPGSWLSLGVSPVAWKTVFVVGYEGSDFVMKIWVGSSLLFSKHRNVVKVVRVHANVLKTLRAAPPPPPYLERAYEHSD